MRKTNGKRFRPRLESDEFDEQIEHSRLEQQIHEAAKKTGLPTHLRLSPQQFQFCVHYVASSKKQQSAIDAGYNPDTAHLQANWLLKQPKVILEIERQRALLATRQMKTQDDVAKLLWDIASSDVRILSPVQVGCCRYCYGIEHGYQYTENELRIARREHERAQRRKPIHQRIDWDDQGGGGFNPYLPPVVDCPECRGRGFDIPKPPGWIDDLPPEIAILISGFKFNKNGEIEIKIRDDRMKALEQFSLMMGFVKQRKLVEVIDPDELTDEQLESSIRKLRAIIERKGAPELTDMTQQSDGSYSVIEEEDGEPDDGPS